MKISRSAGRGRGNGFTSRLVRGDYNAIDDISGLQYKASEMTQQWDGLIVLRADVEERHPQDFLRSRPER